MLPIRGALGGLLLVVVRVEAPVGGVEGEAGSGDQVAGPIERRFGRLVRWIGLGLGIHRLLRTDRGTLHASDGAMPVPVACPPVRREDDFDRIARTTLRHEDDLDRVALALLGDAESLLDLVEWEAVRDKFAAAQLPLGRQ